MMEQPPKNLESLPKKIVVNQPENTHLEGNKIVEEALRRSTQRRRPAIPNNYVVYLEEINYDIGFKEHPTTFKEAIESVESNKWVNAMKDEMNSMAINEVWELVELLEGYQGHWL